MVGMSLCDPAAFLICKIPSATQPTTNLHFPYLSSPAWATKLYYIIVNKVDRPEIVALGTGLGNSWL